MKHKLKIEELRVESFAVEAEAAGERGTVRGFAKPLPTQAQTACQFTCLEDDCHLSFGQSCIPCPVLETVAEFTCLVDDCQPTFVYSCGYPEPCPL